MLTCVAIRRNDASVGVCRLERAVKFFCRLVLLFHHPVTVASGSSSVSATTTAAHQFSMPGAVLVLEVLALLATLAEPQWLILADPYNVKPRVTRLLIGKCEDDINLFKRTERSLWVEEVNKGNDSEVGRSKDDPGAIAYVSEGDRGDDNNTVKDKPQPWQMNHASLTQSLASSWHWY